MEWKVPYSYLQEQYNTALRKRLIPELDNIMAEGDFTLGRRVEDLEKNFSAFIGAKYAVGVGSGTAALELSLRGLDINGEVITTPNTFYATVNAIVAAGARPVFVDVGEDYNINPDLIENAITERTRAIMPVHLTGKPADMDRINKIAKKHDLYVIEDAAQATAARINEKYVGNFGIAAGFSFHPLKNVNGWGDAGMIVTNNENLYNRLKRLRNQGLEGRDLWLEYGQNHRIDPCQAYVINYFLRNEVEVITEKRIENAKYYDKKFKNVEELSIPYREKNIRQVYHTYVLKAKKRDDLYQYLLNKGIDAKIHYPIPLHLQPATKNLGYKEGDFPVTERQAKEIITLPVHQELNDDQICYVIGCVRSFYSDVH